MRNHESEPKTPLATREEWMQELEKRDLERSMPGNGLNFVDTDYLDIKAEGGQRDARQVARALQSFLQNDLYPSEDKHQLRNSEFGSSLADGTVYTLEQAEEVIRDPDVIDHLNARADDLIIRSKELHRKWPEIRSKIISGLGEGRSLGFVPEELTDKKIDRMLDSILVQMRDTLLDESGGGDYHPGVDVIRLFSAGDSAELIHTHVHELRHRLSGGTYEHTDHGTISRNRTGFQTSNKDSSRLINGPLDEAVNEHITVSILYGNWSVLAPSERGDEKEGYAYELNREFLSELINKSGGLIDLATVTRASFEDTTERGGVRARREMVRQFLDAYHVGTVSRFSNAIELMNDFVDRYDSIPETIFSAIEGPKFDRTGKVVEKGYIDLARLEDILSDKPKISGEPLV